MATSSQFDDDNEYLRLERERLAEKRLQRARTLRRMLLEQRLAVRYDVYETTYTATKLMVSPPARTQRAKALTAEELSGLLAPQLTKPVKPVKQQKSKPVKLTKSVGAKRLTVAQQNVLSILWADSPSDLMFVHAVTGISKEKAAVVLKSLIELGLVAEVETGFVIKRRDA